VKIPPVAFANQNEFFFDQIIKDASFCDASDVHIEQNNSSCTVSLKLGERLLKKSIFDPNDGKSLINWLKLIANLDINQSSLPQDGNLNFKQDQTSWAFRFASMPTINVETLVLRFVNKLKIPPHLSQLGLSPNQISQISQILQTQHGLVILCGPTGSGKTTSLFSILQSINKPNLKTITIEDPIEYILDGSVQTQVNDYLDLTFENISKSILRHDPDIVVLGEIRDIGAARAAVQSALAGHLVLTTFHASDIPSAILRLKSMGLDPYLLASTLKGIISQHLEIKEDSSPNARFKDRVGHFEVLTPNDDIKDAIHGNDINRLMHLLNENIVRN
jgi:type II secretory ATPase GspE/PulE/Tfp pilus assembly ATPase PilB-like protein